MRHERTVASLEVHQNFLLLIAFGTLMKLPTMFIQELKLM